MKCFHAYPSQPQTVQVYARSEPLHCDVVEFDTTLSFIPWDVADKLSGCFLAQRDCIVDFHANVLVAAPNNPGVIVNAWIMKNLLPPPDGSIGGEIAGDDVCVPSAGGYVSARVSRKLKLIAGDRVWAVPGINCGGTVLGATGGMNGGNTVNYFEGTILEE